MKYGKATKEDIDKLCKVWWDKLCRPTKKVLSEIYWMRTPSEVDEEQIEYMFRCIHNLSKPE